MGQSIQQDTFSAEDRQCFRDRLQSSIGILKEILAKPDFGQGASSLGAEVEFYLVNPDARVMPVNQAVVKRVNDPQLTLELNRFNLEYNLNPQPFSGTPFKAFEEELQTASTRINEAASELGAELLSIGILPTLREQDMAPEMMTDVPRYHHLSAELKSLRQEAFHVEIDGDPPLNLSCPDVTLEGANTSFQLHWRVPAREFADYYNALQLVTPLALALSGNSPGIFGHWLWEETRIALFKQSIDCRVSEGEKAHQRSRVDFGHGWARDAWSLFAAAVAVHAPLLPILAPEPPETAWKAGRLPDFSELKMHMGSTWPWNRAILDTHDKGHLRIEIRFLPSGPTWTDMSANGLLTIGLALAVLPRITELTAILPFDYAEGNFYRAARRGLDARIIWPSAQTVGLQMLGARELLHQMLPLARQAIAQTDLSSLEADRLFNVVEGRLANGQTGSVWQRQQTRQFEAQADADALQRMTQHYLYLQRQGKPVHEWSIDT